MKAVTQTGGWCRSLEGGGRNEHFTRVLRKEIHLIKIFAFSTTLGCRAETMRSMDGIKISLVGDAVLRHEMSSQIHQNNLQIRKAIMYLSIHYLNRKREG